MVPWAKPQSREDLREFVARAGDGGTSLNCSVLMQRRRNKLIFSYFVLRGKQLGVSP